MSLELPRRLLFCFFARASSAAAPLVRQPPVAQRVRRGAVRCDTDHTAARVACLWREQAENGQLRQSMGAVAPRTSSRTRGTRAAPVLDGGGGGGGRGWGGGQEEAALAVAALQAINIPSWEERSP